MLRPARLRARSTLAAIAAIAAASATLAGAPHRAHAQPEPPLAPFAAQTLSVTPVQFLRADSGAPLRPSQWAAARLELDDSIGVALAERGLGRKWAYAADLARLAKRNAGYASDPYVLGAGGLRNRALKAGEQAPAMLIDNLRSLIALGDSRYALVPVELAFTGRGADARMVLRVVVVDGRVGTLTWYADLVAPAPAHFGSPEIGALAQRVADLVVAR